MEWWEYLIVVAVWFIVFCSIANLVGYDASGGEGQEDARKRLLMVLGSVCLLLLMLITYKLFIDPIGLW